MERKERALKKLIEATIYTGSGEFLELLSGIKDIERITPQDIYRIYDFKTAIYTFASPLSIGAILAGANKKQADILFQYGIYLGRAFQIKDDIIGMFGEELEIGKPNLTDIKEGKRTILTWYAYNNLNKEGKTRIKNILSKRNADKSDLLKMRRIISASGALDYAKKEIHACMNRALRLNASSKIRPQYKELLRDYSEELLKL
jgi:geranylgeranyl diphosphate synthase type I